MRPLQGQSKINGAHMHTLQKMGLSTAGGRSKIDRLHAHSLKMMQPTGRFKATIRAHKS